MPDQTVQLEHETGTIVHLDAGSSIRGAAVIATRGERAAPVPGVSVRYRVLRGELTLGEQRSREVTVADDDAGRAVVELFMATRGTARLAASVGDAAQRIVFSVRTEGVPDRLHFHSTPVFTADDGEISTDIVALDHHGRPVDRAKITLEGMPRGDEAFRGKVKRLGDGLYRGTIRTLGHWISQEECDTIKETAEDFPCE